MHLKSQSPHESVMFTIQTSVPAQKQVNSYRSKAGEFPASPFGQLTSVSQRQYSKEASSYASVISPCNHSVYHWKRCLLMHFFFGYLKWKQWVKTTHLTRYMYRNDILLCHRCSHCMCENGVLSLSACVCVMVSVFVWERKCACVCSTFLKEVSVMETALLCFLQHTVCGVWVCFWVFAMHVACASVLSLTVVSSQVVLNSELRDEYSIFILN